MLKLLYGKPFNTELSLVRAKFRTSITIQSPQSPRLVVVFSNGDTNGSHNPTIHLLGNLFFTGHAITCKIDLLPDASTNKAHNGDSAVHSAEALSSVCDYLKSELSAATLPLICLAMGTGATSALIAAADNPQLIDGLVLCSGQPRPAFSYLQRIQTPTLFIVGEKDRQTNEANRVAFKTLPCVKRFLQLAGSGHLLKEPGALEEAARQTLKWGAAL